MNEPQASLSHPSHDEFAALLEETLSGSALQEGQNGRGIKRGTILQMQGEIRFHIIMIREGYFETVLTLRPEKSF